MRKVFTVAGGQFEEPADITAVVWTGGTSAGDRCVLAEIGGEEIWEGRANDSHTYLGIRFGRGGEHVVGGFEVPVLATGTKLFVYYER